METLRAYLSGIMVVYVVLALGCSDGDTDVDQVAESLADRLTQALEFDQGDKEKGAPPAGSEDGPVIDDVEIPDEFRMDASFLLRLHTSSLAIERLDLTYVHVEGASKHFQIEKAAVESGTGTGIVLEVTGLLDKDELLAGESFTLLFSLQDTDGNAGPAFPVTIAISRLDAECELGDCCNAGAWVPSGQPCLSGQDSFTCTTDACSSSHACEGNLDEGFCIIEELCLSEATEREGKECQVCSPTRNSGGWSNKENGTPCLFDTAADSGDCVDGECVLNRPTRFVESLSMETAQMVSEAKPESENAEGYGIEELVGPLEIRLSSEFFLHLHTTTSPELFQGAVLGVEGARRYWEITALPIRYRDHYRLEIVGRMAQNDLFQESEVTLWVAFRAADGRLGEYQSLSVPIPFAIPECTLATCCNGGAYLPVGFSCDSDDFCMLAPTCAERGVCTGSRYDCNNRGSCNEYDDLCTCNLGFAGDYCQDCAEGYTGDYCQQCATGYYEFPANSHVCVPDPCANDPCNSHGICDNSLGTAQCECYEAYLGETCQSCREGVLGFYPYCFLPPEGYCEATECTAPAASEQTLCYDDTEETACPGEGGGEDCFVTAYCGQDGQYSEEPPAWQCLDENRTLLDDCPAETASGQMVLDPSRKLIWQREARCSVSFQQAEEFCQASSLGGLQDWRLPSPHELHSLVDESRTEPACSQAVWGNPAGLFWTVRANVAYPNYAWTVDFDLGRLNHATKTEAHCSRCVAEWTAGE